MSEPGDAPTEKPSDPTLDTTVVGGMGPGAPSPGAPSPGAPSPALPRFAGEGGERVGHYVIEGELGRGGMGIVHRARDEALGRAVALKMILDARSAGPSGLARFRREAMATAKLRHPGIVTVFDVGEHEGKPFVVLELIEGESLATILGRGPLEPRRAAEIARGVARALAHAHESGIVHRDVKPGNVLVEKSGNPRLMDFGLAHLAEDTTQLTRTGEIVGTPAYMAPEQASARAHGPPADVYGLGAVLYHALAGRAPFQASNIHLVIKQVLEDDPAPLGKVRPGLPTDLETIVHRCLEKDPARRYKTADDLADDLERFLAGEAIRARRVGRLERSGLWVMRNPRVVFALLAFALIGAIAAVSAARLVLRDRAEAQRRKEQADAERARRATVLALLESVRSGDIETKPEGLAATIDRLVALRDAETVDLLVDVLDRSSAVLVEAATAVYLSAQPTPDEALRGATPIPDLERAVGILANRGATPPAPEDVAIILEAERRCEGRARRAASGIGSPPRMGALVGAEQARRLGRSGALLARVACEALGRLGVQAAAQESLIRYLTLERDELRASFAGEALARLGSDEALAVVRKTAWHRYGDLDGIFWQRVSPILAERHRSLPPDAAAVVSRCIEQVHALEERGDTKGAIAELERAIGAVSEQSPVLWNSLGLVRGHAGDLEGAFTAISRAIELSPGSSPFRANRAWIRHQRGDLDGALVDASRAIELDPTFHGGWLNSGVARRAKGDLDAALIDLGRALELSPNDPVTLFNRGSVRADRGDVAGGIRDLDRALEVKPAFAAALETRSQLHRRRGAPGAAIADASRATEVAPRSPSAWNELASAHISNGEPAAAIAAAGHALELDPRNATAYSLRGGAKAAKGDVEGGLADLSSAIAIDSRCVAAIANRGTLRASRGDLAGGIEDFTRAIDIDPRVPERWFNRGHARFNKGDLDEAIADLTRAIELRPGLAPAWGVRGLAKKKKGDKEGAKADLRRAIELGPRAPGARGARAALAELEGPEPDDD